MAEKFVSERNLKFLLYEVFDATSLTQYPYYKEHNLDIFDMVIETALKIGKDILRPNLQEMDKNPPQYVDGQVRVHPCEGGWIGSNAPVEMGGQQLPLMIAFACRFIFSAANYSAMVYPLLTDGAAHLIEVFGTDYGLDRTPGGQLCGRHNDRGGAHRGRLLRDPGAKNIYFCIGSRRR